jgi:adenylylsulfate kinase-like enzyme
MQLKTNGIWLYGLAGSGKTFASKCLMQTIQKGFMIDGDNVRKFISTDLDYTVDDRRIQLKRLLGISKLTLLNGFVPIVSSVTMNTEILGACRYIGINVVEIQRSETERYKARNLYVTKMNVVGVDIEFEHLNTDKILNCGTHLFEQDILKYALKAE